MRTVASALLVLCLMATAASAKQLAFNVSWTWTPQWSESLTMSNLVMSTFETDTAYAYAPRLSWVNTSKSYVVALNTATGKERWIAALGHDSPGYCDFVESAGTVACMGVAQFAVFNRSTGAIISAGEYMKGYRIYTGNYGMGAFTASINQYNAISLVNETNTTAIYGAMFDASTGYITPMGHVSTNNRTAVGIWGGELTTNADSTEIVWFVTYWTMHNFVVAGEACSDVFTVRFSTSGTARIQSRLPQAFSNGAGTTVGEYCPIPKVSVHVGAGVVLGIPPSHPDTVSAYHIRNGTRAYAINVSAVAGTITTMMPFTAYGGAQLLLQTQCGLSALDTYNITLWTYSNCAVANGMITNWDASTVTVGGLVSNRITRFALDTGLSKWSTPLGFDDPSIMWVQPGDAADVLFRSSKVLIIDAAHGSIRLNLDVSALGLSYAQSGVFTPSGKGPGVGTLLLGCTEIVSVSTVPV